jgi:uncharacterized repeat protein (TIGR01451 family)
MAQWPAAAAGDIVKYTTAAANTVTPAATTIRNISLPTVS